MQSADEIDFVLMDLHISFLTLRSPTLISLKKKSNITQVGDKIIKY